MDITYRKFEEFGHEYYRILTRRNTSDAWRMAIGEFDRDDETMTRVRVQELSRSLPAYIVREGL